MKTVHPKYLWFVESVLTERQHNLRSEKLEGLFFVVVLCPLVDFLGRRGVFDIGICAKRGR